MKVTFIGHSCYLVEIRDTYLLFDCIAFEKEQEKFGLGCAGVMPDMDPTKELVVFVSHKHEDHYSPSIWTLRNKFTNIRFVISRDVVPSENEQEELGIAVNDDDRILVVKGRKEYELPLMDGSILKIETLVSNDLGVAYFLSLYGKTIYHAGDLHYWVWDEEDPSVNDYLVKCFEKELKRLQDREADVAFLLIDTRLNADIFEGMDQYLQTMNVKHVFPVHFWEHYNVIREYKESRAKESFADAIVCVEHTGQEFVIPD